MPVEVVVLKNDTQGAVEWAAQFDGSVFLAGTTGHASNTRLLHQGIARAGLDWLESPNTGIIFRKVIGHIDCFGLITIMFSEVKGWIPLSETSALIMSSRNVYAAA